MPYEGLSSAQRTVLGSKKPNVLFRDFFCRNKRGPLAGIFSFRFFSLKKAVDCNFPRANLNGFPYKMSLGISDKISESS